MRHLRALRRALAPLAPLILLVMALAACGGSDGSGPDDDDVFGTYTLVRAGGQTVPPLALVTRATIGPGAFIDTFVESGSFRILEDGTWAFEFHFVQEATSNDPDLPDQVSEYDVADSGTYSMQNGIITLDGGATATLSGDGVLSRSVVYSNIPGAAPATVVYEYEK